jgi:predicted nucleic acid-binding protein
MAIVVSDTSPLRALEHLGHLDWLEDFFDQVFLPPAVASELAHPPAAFKPLEVSSWPFLQIRTPHNTARVAELRTVLDAGEAEAIALAEEIRADVVLIDELAGRDVAQGSGLTVLGTLGILLEAKQRGACPAVRPLLDRLETELSFFVSSALREVILRLAGESE